MSNNHTHAPASTPRPSSGVGINGEICGFPPIRQFDDLTLYTGTMSLPAENPDRRRREAVAKGRKVNREISGIRISKSGNRRSCPCWRVEIHASRAKDGFGHPAFNYECQTKEEAAYIATMAHKALKPWFFMNSLKGTRRAGPARPGDRNYFWNNIWGLWKYAMIRDSDGEPLIVAATTEPMRCFITDLRTDLYEALVSGPFFYRTTIDRRRNLEPVQPNVYLDDEGRARVRWIRLGELVTGRPGPYPGGGRAGRDFREANLVGLNPKPLIPIPESGPIVWRPEEPPYRFNATDPVPGMEEFHPYLRGG